jgi:predicted MFS family arabinose efflux permease
MPDFRWLHLGTTLSKGAKWIQKVTLSWLVYDLTTSGASLGALNLVRSVATLGLAPLAGVAIDRLSRRMLMFAANGWLLTISLALGIALLAGRAAIWQLFAFSFLGGVAQAIEMPLRQTVVFVLVPRLLAPSAVALVQTGWALMRSLGPALGGFLILWFGPAGNFLVQAGAYALITLTIARISFPPGRVADPRENARGGMREGLRYVATERTTRAFLLLGWVLPLLIIPNFAALPPIYAKDIFQGGPQVLGALLSAVGIGGIAGGLVAAAQTRVDRRGVLQLAALLLLSMALIGFALSSDLWVALPLLALE